MALLAVSFSANQSDVPVAPVVAGMAVGVVVAVLGHVVQSSRVVAAGLVVLFLATAGMVVAGLAAYHQNPNDPRPCAYQVAC
jgi:hypothetical protein